MLVSELVLASAARQLELLRSGKVSVAELAEAHIRQIERVNPVLNALVDFDAERVRAQARARACWRWFGVSGLIDAFVVRRSPRLADVTDRPPVSLENL